MMAQDNVSEAQLRNELKARVSGFKPMVSGRLCDMSNEAVSKGDSVFVELERRDGRGWEPVRMHAESVPIELDSSPGGIAHAVVKTEIMDILDDMHAVHGNPEVIDISPKGEARGDYKNV